jgi:L-rhamnose mutarotase
MANLLIRMKVQEYETWKKCFNESIELRKEGGARSYQIFHPYDDPTNLFVLFEWDDLSKAKKFIESPLLREKMDDAGIIDQPDIYFLTKVTEGTL